MPHFVIAAENAGARLYKVGRVGLDPGTQDTGGVFTAVGKTERFSPGGEDGLVYFRRVALRVWRTGAVTVTLKAWVDGARTQISGADQTVVIVEAAPTGPTEFPLFEMAIEAQGTSIEVEFSIDSDDVTGVALPETIEVHGLVLRAAKSRNAETA